MLSELERIEGSGHDTQLLSLVRLPFAAAAGPFEHVPEVNQAQDGQRPDI